MQGWGKNFYLDMQLDKPELFGICTALWVSSEIGMQSETGHPYDMSVKKKTLGI